MADWISRRSRGTTRQSLLHGWRAFATIEQGSCLLGVEKNNLSSLPCNWQWHAIYCCISGQNKICPARGFDPLICRTSYRRCITRGLFKGTLPRPLCSPKTSLAREWGLGCAFDSLRSDTNVKHLQAILGCRRSRGKVRIQLVPGMGVGVCQHIVRHHTQFSGGVLPTLDGAQRRTTETRRFAGR